MNESVSPPTWTQEALDDLGLISFVGSADFGSIQYVSPAFENVLGRKASDIIENPELWMEIVHPDDLPKIQQIFASGGGRDFSIEGSHTFRVIRPGGETRWIQTRSVALPVNPGETPLVAGIATDITETKRVEEELRAQGDSSNRLLDTAQVIVLVLDTAGRIVRFNRHMETVSGYTLEEMRGKDGFETFLPNSDHDRIRALFREAVADYRVVGQVNPIVTKRGEERFIEWNAQALTGSDGTVLGLLSTGQDITARLEAEQALKHAYESLRTRVRERSQKLSAANEVLKAEIAERQRNGKRYKQLFDSLPHPAYVWRIVGDDFELIEHNAAASAVTQGGISSVLGMRASELYSDRPRIIDGLKTCAASEETHAEEMEYEFKTVELKRWLRVTFAFAPPEFIHIHTEDTTDERAAHLELERSEAELRLITDSVPAMVAYVDRDRRFQFANQAYEEPPASG